MNPAGKTFLITGANSGIGKVTAMELARQKAQVVMLCRNRRKAENARKEIFKISGNEDVHILECDLSSQEQIHAAAEQFRDRFEQLDVLINNAGILAGNDRQITPEGFEKTFAVNHLAPYTLSLLLLDLIKESSSGRILTVSSEAHRFARFDPETLHPEPRFFSGLNDYAFSKLCNIWFTRQLARLTEAGSLTVNCLHPGFVASGFGKNSSPLYSAVLNLSSPFAVNSLKGAKGTLYLAGSPEVKNISGKYFKKQSKSFPPKML